MKKNPYDLLRNVEKIAKKPLNSKPFKPLNSKSSKTSEVSVQVQSSLKLTKTNNVQN